MRPDVADCLRLDDNQRRYEEDPYTGEWTSIAPTRIVAGVRGSKSISTARATRLFISRRPMPGDSTSGSARRPQELVSRSLRAYDDFYAHLRHLLERLVADHGQVVVFDLHSYNHIREGAGGAAAEAEGNPEINLGTGTMARALWSPIVDRWLTAMREYDYLGRRLDVRENVKFFGGQLPRWIHENFPNSVCALAIEVKKFFMNEWTGELDSEQHQAIGQRASAQPPPRSSDELEKI